MSEQPPTTPLSSRVPSSSPLSFHHTPPQFSIKSESSSVSTKNEPNYELASHARFSQVARSFLPGRPDLTSTTPTPSSKISFTPATSSPLSTSIKEESSPFTSRIKDDTSTAPSSANSAPVFRGQAPTPQPTKPAHLTHLTEAEYRARVQQIMSTRACLASAMKESLDLTRRQAIRHRKRYGQLEALNETNGMYHVTNTIDGLTRLTASLEIDRQVGMNGMMGGKDNVDEADLRTLKRAASILQKVAGAPGWFREG